MLEGQLGAYDTFLWAMRKRVFGHMRTAKVQISLRVRAV